MYILLSVSSSLTLTSGTSETSILLEKPKPSTRSTSSDPPLTTLFHLLWQS